MWPWNRGPSSRGASCGCACREMDVCASTCIITEVQMLRMYTLSTFFMHKKKKKI